MVEYNTPGKKIFIQDESYNIINHLSLNISDTCVSHTSKLITKPEMLANQPEKINLEKGKDILECINKDHSLFMIEFNEEDCRGFSLMPLDHHKFRIMFDYNCLHYKNVKIKDKLFKCLVKAKGLKINLTKISLDLRHNILNFVYRDIPFKHNVLSSVILYLIQAMSTSFLRKGNLRYNLRDHMKILFYPIYPFYKTIDIPKCNKSDAQFYTDFRDLFEVLTILRKSTISFDNQDLTIYENLINK